jgi:hypothetical protein
VLRCSNRFHDKFILIKVVIEKLVVNLQSTSHTVAAFASRIEAGKLYSSSLYYSAGSKHDPVCLLHPRLLIVHLARLCRYVFVYR